MNNGHWLITEINGDWVSELDASGRVLWSTHPPGVGYPSDSNEISANRYLTVDYSNPGQLVNDDRNHRVIVVDPKTDRIVWQYGHTHIRGRGPGYLDNPDGVDLVTPYALLTLHASTLTSP